LANNIFTKHVINKDVQLVCTILLVITTTDRRCEMTKELKTYKQKHDELVASLRTEIESLKLSRNAFQKKAKEAAEELKKSNRAAANMKGQLTKAKKKIAEKNDNEKVIDDQAKQLFYFADEIERKNKIILDANDEMKKKAAEISRLKSKIDNGCNNNDALVAKLTQTTQMLHSMREQRDRKDAEIVKLRKIASRITCSDESVESLEKKLDAEKQKNAELNKELINSEKVAKRKTEIEAEFKAEREEKYKQQKLWNKKESVFLEQIDNLQNENRACTEQIERLLIERKAAMTELKAWASVISQGADKIQQYYWGQE
jgi:chromosome segregation ATPase